MTPAEKEALKQKILNANSSHITDEDFSVFGDDDPEVFVKLVSFDTFRNNYYKNLSESLKNNKEIVVKAAKCSFNIPFIPTHFFKDKDVIKSIIYNRNEELIPVEFLTEDIINYMFVTCCRSSLSSDNIKLACDKYLKKESLIKVLLHQNQFYSTCRKEGSHPGIDSIYVPEHFLNDNDVLQLLITPQFRLIENNEHITKEMILELSQSGFLIQKLPKKFYHDIDFIKDILKFEGNYQFFDDGYFVETFENNKELNLEFVSINPDVVKSQRYPLLFESFQKLFEEDIDNLYLTIRVIDEDREKLFNYLTSHEILSKFENKGKNLNPEIKEKYNFDKLYSYSSYYKNPIIDNKFIIEEMAKQDKVLFPYLSKDIANDNQFMFKIIVEHQATTDWRENPVDELFSKIRHFGSFEKYVDNLKLENKLSSTLTEKPSGKKNKI